MEMSDETAQEILQVPECQGGSAESGGEEKEKRRINSAASPPVICQSQNTFAAIVDLPEGEHQYKFYVDGQWTHDPAEVSGRSHCSS